MDRNIRAVGLVPSQQVVSLQFNSNNEYLNIPSGQTVVPFIKIYPSGATSLTETLNPVLVWFNDRVERQWIATSLSLDKRKILKLSAAKSQYEIVKSSGIIVDDIALNCDEESRNLFAGLHVLLFTKISNGQIQPSQTINIYDKYGFIINKPAFEIINLILQYGLIYKNRFDTYNAKVNAIKSATTNEELDLIL